MVKNCAKLRLEFAQAVHMLRNGNQTSNDYKNSIPKLSLRQIAELLQTSKSRVETALRDTS